MEEHCAISKAKSIQPVLLGLLLGTQEPREVTQLGQEDLEDLTGT